MSHVEDLSGPQTTFSQDISNFGVGAAYTLVYYYLVDESAEDFTCDVTASVGGVAFDTLILDNTDAETFVYQEHQATFLATESAANSTMSVQCTFFGEEVDISFDSFSLTAAPDNVGCIASETTGRTGTT